MNTFKKILRTKLSSLSYFYEYLKEKVFVAIALNIILGLLDGLGLSMFLPLLQMTDKNISADSEAMGNLGFLVEWLQALGITVTLRISLILIIVFFVLKGIVYYFKGVYQVNVQQLFIKRVRLQNIHNLSDLSYEHFVKADVGRIQNTLTGEVEKVAKACQTYFQSFQHGILVSVYIGFAFFADWQFAIMVCVGGLFSDLIYRQIYKNTKGASRKLTLESNFFQSLIIQAVANFKYLKATGEMEKYRNKIEEQVEFIEANNKKIGVLGAILNASREPLSIIVVSIVIILQTALFNSSLAAILISLLFFYRALTSLMQFQSSWNTYLSVSGSLENMENFTAELNSFKEGTGSIKIKKFEDSIEMDTVAFQQDDVSILEDITLVIKKKETIAFAGESGSGKTTLVNLISGLLPITSGSFRIDGIEISEIDINSYRKKIGYITQEPVIFNDSIFNNVTLWAEQSPDNLLKFENACKTSAIWEFIESRPDGIESVLGNNGVNLSGGQKQRISIARELFKESDILILDEATSALDSETEKEIQKNIEDLKGKLTLILIAHRLSTIKNADRIVFLKQGRILQTDSFDDLMKGNAEFRNMVKLQEVTSVTANT